jgi:hypothetical protein
MTVIVASAIRLPDDGRVFVGKRHGDAGHIALEMLGLEPGFYYDSGFLTSDLQFLTRKEAYKLAKKNGQFKRGDTGFHSKELYSEDLW